MREAVKLQCHGLQIILALRTVRTSFKFSELSLLLAVRTSYEGSTILRILCDYLLPVTIMALYECPSQRKYLSTSNLLSMKYLFGKIYIILWDINSTCYLIIGKNLTRCFSLLLYCSISQCYILLYVNELHK